ncbi:MAG: hypothetical protein ABIF82_02330, partial [Planctomycetota bacterium]
MMKTNKGLRVVALVTCLSALAQWGFAAPVVLDIDMIANAQVADGGTIYRQTTATGSGTGSLDVFLQVTGTTGVDPITWGYNNDAGTQPYDHENDPEVNEGWTRSLPLIDVPLFDFNGGTLYREFLFDGNEGGDKVIEITQLEIYTVDNNPDINSLATLQATGSLAYSLDKPAGAG